MNHLKAFNIKILTTKNIIKIMIIIFNASVSENQLIRRLYE